MTSATFWDNIADRYAKSPVKDPSAYEHTLTRTKTYLHESDRVLEVGAGTGTTALKLAPYVKEITATDISARMTEIGRGKAWEQSIHNVDFLQAGIASPALEGQTYDAVLGFNLLHLTGDLETALAHLAPLVKPGGYLITKSPGLAESSFLIYLLIQFMRLIGKAPEINFFTTKQLEDAIRNAGFEILETGDFPKKPPAHFVVARRL